MSTMTVPALRDLKIPVWSAVGVLVVGVGLGYLVGNHEDDPTLSSQTGTVDTVDTEQGIVCLSSGGDNECYRAPGAGLTPGDQVTYVVEPVSVDPDNRDAGTHNTVIWVKKEQ